MASRQEVNFKRLLSRCEGLASEKNKSDWRLEKYVSSLSTQLTDLRKSTSRPTQEVLTDYVRKVEFLKGILEAEKLPTASEKGVAVDLLAPSPPSSQTSTPNRELQLLTKARYQKDAREELLGTADSKDERNGLRHRGGKSGPDADGDLQTEDVDAVIKFHNQQQEKLAEEMVLLARNMKENAKVASKIVQDDNRKLGDSTKMAEGNYGKLKVESDRLEKHVAKACNWWIWIMLVLVCVTFIWMVLFMRMFPKR